MVIETVKMSSKGQIVIPQGIRESINADEGTVFAAVASEDAVILKKIKSPTKEELLAELGKIASQGRKRLEKKGIKESDIPDIVNKRRWKK